MKGTNWGPNKGLRSAQISLNSTWVADQVNVVPTEFSLSYAIEIKHL